MKTWEQLRNASDEAILEWAGEQPWARAMAACGQDREWHAEGDVWTHTKLVARALCSLEEWIRFTREEQLILLFAVLFHDSGKPATTQIDEASGHTISPNHSKTGMLLARRVLLELETPMEIRERIAMLARFHGRPQHLLSKPSPELEVIKLSWLLSNRLLYWLALADTRGRVTAEMSRSEENLALWRLVSEEQCCWEAPYPFTNDSARFLFYRDQLTDLSYTPYEKFTCTMTIACGLPAAGKDTWVAEQAGERPVVSLDSLREEMEIDPEENQGVVAQAAREHCKVHLRAGTDFILNATNITRQVRKRWADLATDYRARVEMVYLDASLPQVLNRNRKREQPVPEKIMRRLAEKLEPPTLTECHRLTVVSQAGTTPW